MCRVRKPPSSSLSLLGGYMCYHKSHSHRSFAFPLLSIKLASILAIFILTTHISRALQLPRHVPPVLSPEGIQSSFSSDPSVNTPKQQSFRSFKKLCTAYEYCCSCIQNGQKPPQDLFILGWHSQVLYWDDHRTTAVHKREETTLHSPARRNAPRTKRSSCEISG